MPLTRSAIKKLRRDRKKEKENERFEHTLKTALKQARRTRAADAVKKAVSFIDKAVKKNLMHRNKAARLKSSLSKQPSVEVSGGTKKKGVNRTGKKKKITLPQTSVPAQK